MVYAIVGPTGVGKTKFSIMLAKRLNAEIINCDSQQVYKELSIGVAKIKEEEKEGIVHHLIDNVSVLDNYSVYEYQIDARKVLDSLLSMNKNVEKMEWEEIKKCAVLGNAVAGLCVQKRGGIPAIPTKEAVLEFMQK